MTLNKDNLAFSSFNNPFQNYESTQGVLNISSLSYTDYEYKIATTTIAMGGSDASWQVLQNFSTSPTKWHVGSYVQVDIDANFDAQTRIDITGSVMTVTLFVINQSGVPANNTPFTLTLEVRRFIGPFA